MLFAESESVFTGDLAVELADVGPYLARFRNFDPASEEIARHLLESHAGMLVVLPVEPGAAPIGFSQLHRHFRKFNVVYDPGGKPLFFRYYDPRVIVDVLAVLSPDPARRISSVPWNCWSSSTPMAWRPATGSRPVSSRSTTDRTRRVTRSRPRPSGAVVAVAASSVGSASCSRKRTRRRAARSPRRKGVGR